MLNFKSFIIEVLKKIEGTQKGSNPGGVHVDEHGQKHYLKHYRDPEQAKVEALTGKIYHHMGIKTVHPELHGHDGIKTKWNEHLRPLTDHEASNLSKKHAHQLSKMYHGAVLTKNWDVIGPIDRGNVLHNDKTGDLHSIDHGGAFHFRAQGGHKDYTPDNAEKHSLRHDQGLSSEMINHAFEKHPGAERHGLEAVKKMDMDHVHRLFKDSGLKDWKDLHKTFVKRREAHLKSYGETQ